jgi:hypothetical protein
VTMNFCPKCGRQRNGNARFCGGCGHEYSDAATSDVTALTAEPAAEVAQDGNPAEAAEPSAWDAPTDATPWDQPAGATKWDRPADATRMDLAPEPTRMDLSGPPATQQPTAQQPTGRQPGQGEPDPFASWFVPGTPPEQPTETVLAYRGNSGAGYSQPAQPGQPAPPPQPPYSPSPYPPTPDRRSSGGRRALWIVVPLVAILAGGAAFALVKTLGKHPVAQPTTSSTVHASSSAASTPPASSSATASASAAASTSATATPTASPSLVAVAGSVGSNTATAPVETVLSQYFNGINTHNYAEYSSTLTAQNKANQPQSSFQSGYSTTTDSGMTLTSLTSTGGGDLTATVTFTSHQSPADSVDNSSCNNWTLNFYLVPNGTGYLISPAPSGYQPTYSDC